MLCWGYLEMALFRIVFDCHHVVCRVTLSSKVKVVTLVAENGQ